MIPLAALLKLSTKFLFLIAIDPAEKCFLLLPHLPLLRFVFMVITQQMQEPVDGQVEEFPPERMAIFRLGPGRGDADHHIAQELRFFAGLGFSRFRHGKGKDIRGRVDSPVIPVKLLDLLFTLSVTPTSPSFPWARKTSSARRVRASSVLFDLYLPLPVIDYYPQQASSSPPRSLNHPGI